VARINTASQRTDLLPWAFAHNALLAPVIGACAIDVAPPVDHPVFARRATTGMKLWDTELRPPKRQRGQSPDAHTAVGANDRLRLWRWSHAFKFLSFTRFERA
jgi:hypothetical protein